MNTQKHIEPNDVEAVLKQMLKEYLILRINKRVVDGNPYVYITLSTGKVAGPYKEFTILNIYNLYSHKSRAPPYWFLIKYPKPYLYEPDDSEAELSESYE